MTATVVRLARIEAALASRPTKRTAEAVARYRADPTFLMRDAGFTRDPWQCDLLRSEAKRILICAARQVGKSSACAQLALYTAITQPGSTTTVVAPVEEQANELLRKIATAY